MNATLATFIQHGIGSPSHSDQTGKRGEGAQTGVKLSLFADDMTHKNPSQ